MTGTRNPFRTVYGQLLAAAILFAPAAFGQCSTCTSALNLPPAPTIALQTQSSSAGTASSFITATLLGTPTGYSVADGNYLAWCVDDPAAPLGDPGVGQLYSTANNAALPADFQNANWPRVNYVLNNKTGTFQDVQRVIWLLLRGSSATLPFADSAAAQSMYNAAMANGASFVSGPGQIVAVLLYQDGPGGSQETVIEVKLPECGSIGNYVWLDADRNGIQDSTEAGINGVTVRLLNNLGQQVASTTTQTVSGIAGSYLFSGLCTGAYTVVVDTPTGLLPTASGAGSDRGLDSNGSPASVSIDTSNPATATNLTIDFGFAPAADACSASVGDFVWFDANSNGIQDANEFGLPNVLVQLTIGNTVMSTRTDVNGKYLFTGLCSGNFSIQVINPSTPQSGRPGLQNTATTAGTDRAKDSNPIPSWFTLTSGSSDLTQDFGFKPFAGGCTLTQGYWKNHASVWPITSLVMGGKTYTQAELLTILGTPVRGDDSIILAYQLIAAKLNLYSGSAMPTSVPAWITQADAVLAQYAGKIPLKLSSASMVSLGGNLDNYNNGRISGASHCN